MENKEKLGQEPAFPIKHKELTPFGELERIELGMTKRFYAACAAMQGMLCNQNITHFPDEVIIRTSYKLADELLKQENE